MFQQRYQHASSPYQTISGLLRVGEFFRPLYSGLKRQTRRIHRFSENTTHPVYQKGSLPAAGEILGVAHVIMQISKLFQKIA